MKRVVSFLFLALFCNGLFCDGGYEKMVDESFDNFSDVMKFFPKDVQDVEKRIEFAVSMAKKNLNQITNLKESEYTFENVMRAYDQTARKFGFFMNGLHMIELVHPEKALRDACHDGVLKLEEFSIDWFYKVGLYKVMKDYVENRLGSEKLSDEEKYFCSEQLKDFEKKGLHLPEKKLKKVKELKKEISRLEMEFSRNIALDNSFFLVDRDELVGTSESFINSLHKEDGKYKLTCDYPVFFEVIKHCSVGKTRKSLTSKFRNRAYPKNKEILENLIKKRDQYAKALGFQTFSHYDISDQMAKSPKTVAKFVKDLSKKVKEKERKEIKAFMKDLPEGVNLVDGRFKPEDFLYVVEQHKKKNYDFDEREFAEYFTMEKTIDGIFKIYQEFLGLNFKLIKSDGLEGLTKSGGIWHEDVMVIEARKKGSDIVEGYVILDLHPRKDKYSHACCASLVSPIHPIDGKKPFPAVNAVIANFPRSTADRPSLLKHKDIITFFHEFGHAMHHLLSRTQMNLFAGYHTRHDFVEVPSQMFEEWMWDREMLKKISSHYKTGAPLPDDLIDKMLALKNLHSGYEVKRMSVRTLASLGYFAGGQDKDVDKLWREYFEKFNWHTNYDPDNHGYASFGHLSGYAAKYYCYLWSQVISLDFFDEIKKHGLLNSEIGEKLINEMLGKGGSVDPNILVKNFLGRESTQEAFLKDIGV